MIVLIRSSPGIGVGMGERMLINAVSTYQRSIQLSHMKGEGGICMLMFCIVIARLSNTKKSWAVSSLPQP